MCYQLVVSRRWLLPLALVTAFGALGAVVVSGCDVPIGAIRRSPPKGLDAHIVSAGVDAARFTLDGTTGKLSLDAVLADDRALLVFYRGHW